MGYLLLLPPSKQLWPVLHNGPGDAPEIVPSTGIFGSEPNAWFLGPTGLDSIPQMAVHLSWFCHICRAHSCNQHGHSNHATSVEIGCICELLECHAAF